MKVIIITAIILTALYLLIYKFRPNFNLVQIGRHRFKLLLWYDVKRDGFTIRKYIKLLEFKTGKQE